MALQEDALRLAGHGLSVLPIEKGTKKFKGVSWKAYQSRLMEESEIATMFVEGDSLAVVCGAVSGNLELMDFDIPGKHEIVPGSKGVSPCFKAFLLFCKDHDFEYLIKRLLIVETKSGGKHLLYRCPDGIEGNQKLAENEDRETLIETRGEGGYFLTFPTPGYTIKQGSFDCIPTITAHEREFLLTAARSFNEVYEEHFAGHKVQGPGLKPGEDFNQKANWEDILTKHGWTLGGRSGGNRTAWVRPGKTKKEGIGGTTGNGPSDLLFIHTTNAPPFEVRKSYSKFAAYALLECGGDFHHAAQALKSEGYGSQAPTNGQAKPTIIHQIEAPSIRILRKASDVEAKEVDWLLFPYLPKGMTVGMEGQPGIGKTFVLLAIAAAMSTGRSLSFLDTPTALGTTLFWTLDDSAEYTLKPRLERMEADLSRIYLEDAQLILNRAGLQEMRSLIKHYNLSWFVLDPLAKFIDPVIKCSRPELSLSEIMTELKTISEETGCTITPNRHLRKGRSGDPISDGYGGIEIIGGYRSAIRVDKDPDNPPRAGSSFGIVSHIKNNVGPIGSAFGYEIRPVNKTLAELWWTGSREFDPATSAQSVTQDPVEFKDARAFLLHELGRGQTEKATILEKLAAAQGITKKMLRTARESLCEPPLRMGFGDQSCVFWKLKESFVKVDPYELP